MEVSRRCFGYIIASLYLMAGVLLLADYWSGAAEPGAHLALAWHVAPVSLCAQFVAEIHVQSGPLQANWPLAESWLIAGYSGAVLICTAILFRLVGGRAV